MMKMRRLNNLIGAHILYVSVDRGGGKDKAHFVINDFYQGGKITG